MPPKKKESSSGGATAAKQKVSVGQKVLIAVGILAGLGAIAAGLGSFDYEAYKRRRLWYAEQAKLKTLQTVQTQQKTQAYQRVYPGMLVKANDKTPVYYIAANYKRYVIPNQATFDSWFAGSGQSIIGIPNDQLVKISYGGNVRIRPGSRPVKLTTDPKVYTITKGGVLHWITTEAMMEQMYGPKWNLKITVLPDVLAADYSIGQPMTSLSSPYHPTKAQAEAPTIDHDLGLK